MIVLCLYNKATLGYVIDAILQVTLHNKVFHVRSYEVRCPCLICHLLPGVSLDTVPSGPALMKLLTVVQMAHTTPSRASQDVEPTRKQIMENNVLRWAGSVISPVLITMC